MTHTPGPWNISTDGEAAGVIYALRGFEWDDICVITPRCEAAANAHLIAAAPDMLAVLEKLSSLLVDGEEYVPLELREELTTAIRKARGEGRHTRRKNGTFVAHIALNVRLLVIATGVIK